MPTLTPISSNGTNPQLQNAIERILPKAVAQPETKALALKLRGSNDYETSRNIFNWVLTNIKYKKDGRHQIIKLPSALLVVKEGDCKSMSLLVASLLINNGITPKFVYTSYKPNDPTPSHIYVETENGIIMDVVWKRFNSEKKPAYKKKKIMNISYLSGVDGCASCGLGAVDTKSKIKQTAQTVKSKVSSTVSKVGQGAKVVGLSAGRSLFLTIVKNNLDGIATKLSTGNLANQISIWKKAGGNATKFQNALKFGSQKPAKKFGFLGKLKGRIARRKINGLFGGIGETEDKALENGIRAIAIATGTAVGSSAPVVGTAVGAGAGTSLGEVLVIILPIIKEAVAKTPATEALSENASLNPTGTLDGELDVSADEDKGLKPMDDDTKGNYNKVLLYGAIAVGGYLAYQKFVLKKKKLF